MTCRPATRIRCGASGGTAASCGGPDATGRGIPGHGDGQGRRGPVLCPGVAEWRGAGRRRSGGLIAWTNAGVEILGGHAGGTFVVTDQWSAGATVIFDVGGPENPWVVSRRIRCVLDTRRGTRVGLHDGHAARLGSTSPQSLHDGSVRAMTCRARRPPDCRADGRIRIWEEAGDTSVDGVDWPQGRGYRLEARRIPGGSASRDRTVAVWNASDLALEARLSRSSGEGHTRSVNALCWLDDHTIATGGDDRRILLWERRSD